LQIAAMQIIGYLASLLIGISLGMIGGGGSILTVPVLVYLFGISPILSTSYSLFVVGTTSLAGAYNNYRKRQVNIKTALLFGLSSITTVLLTRKFLVHRIPAIIGNIGRFQITQSLLIMVSFAFLMMAASLSMIRNNTLENEIVQTPKASLYKLLLYGIAIGFATGFLGAGGGFLLIPTLVLLVKLPMKEAIGTSLFIIALNSLIGFTGDLGHFEIDWIFLFKITSIAIGGIFIGGYLNKKIAGYKLKKGFGWFVLIMGIYIFIKEIFL